jgi:hypothetical protein
VMVTVCGEAGGLRGGDEWN